MRSTACRWAPSKILGGVSHTAGPSSHGLFTVEQDGVQTTALEIENDKIVAIYVMRNPDKLTRRSVT
jgi:hypothetical protein